MKAAWRWLVCIVQLVAGVFSLAWRSYLSNADEREKFRKENQGMAAHFDNEKGVWP